MVKTIIENRGGILWFGTANGLSSYDGKTVTHFTAKDELKDDMVFSSFQDRSRRM